MASESPEYSVRQLSRRVSIQRKAKRYPLVEEYLRNKAAERYWKTVVSVCIVVFTLLLLIFFFQDFAHVKAGWAGVVNLYTQLDAHIFLFVLAGFVAQLVDGALGMGYGVTSASILLSTGISPAAISASIHTSEIFSSAASGYSHYRFGNVNKKLFKALVIPGVIGAGVGAFVLVYVGEENGKLLRPIVAAYTLLLGIKIILHAFREIKPQKKFRQYRALAAIGGFCDSFGGGGWGPIVTSTLIQRGRSHKYVVGSVSLTEFFITFTSAITFFTLIGVSHWQVILALVLGSITAAPLATRLAGKLPKKAAYLLLGVLVIVWSARMLFQWLV